MTHNRLLYVMTIEEFKSEVMPVKNKLYRFALRLLGDSEDARDTVQEMLLRLWTKRDKLNEYSRWLEKLLNKETEKENNFESAVHSN